MARATKAQSEITAQRILHAGTSLFAECGYAAVALDEVATSAQVTRGAVYHHFHSKQGLFQAVAAACQQHVAAAVSTAADEAGDPWEGFVAGCRAFLVTSSADTYRQILLIDAPAVLGWRTWRSQDAAASGRHLLEAITELAASGRIKVHSAHATATLLSGAMNEAALQIAGAEDRTSALDDVWNGLLQLLSGLRG